MYAHTIEAVEGKVRPSFVHLLSYCQQQETVEGVVNVHNSGYEDSQNNNSITQTQ